MKTELISLAWLQARVIERDGCWVWTGCVGNYGTQPQARVGGKTQNVRRMVWTMTHGRVPEKGRRIGSTCECILCVHPDHMISRRNGELLLGRKQGLLQIARNAAAQRARSNLPQSDVPKIISGEIGPDEFVEKYGMSRAHYYRVQSGEFRRDYSSNPFAGLGI